MITIKEEPKELIKQFKVYENCYFCRKQTSTWNLATNTPVCKSCAETREQSDIKKNQTQTPKP